MTLFVELIQIHIFLYEILTTGCLTKQAQSAERCVRVEILKFCSPSSLTGEACSTCTAVRGGGVWCVVCVSLQKV